MWTVLNAVGNGFSCHLDYGGQARRPAREEHDSVAVSTASLVVVLLGSNRYECVSTVLASRCLHYARLCIGECRGRNLSVIEYMKGNFSKVDRETIAIPDARKRIQVSRGSSFGAVLDLVGGLLSGLAQAH